MIDWERVAELRAEVGDDAFEDVTEMFFEEAEEIVERFGSGTVTGWEEEFHALKSAALNMGFCGVARLCQDAELRARAGQADATDAAAVTACLKVSKATYIHGPGP